MRVPGWLEGCKYLTGKQKEVSEARFEQDCTRCSFWVVVWVTLGPRLVRRLLVPDREAERSELEGSVRTAQNAYVHCDKHFCDHQGNCYAGDTDIRFELCR